ncbi:hypothetical protein ACIRU8_15045 [Streptomyces sp. NPDC101175]|uniref:hypothetical protein n=1 Tax=Streptomyces sp. NPDC101175 TaxID=3366123 RepID=UPI003833CFB7
MTIVQTTVAVPLELLRSKTITVLTDSFQAAFMVTHEEERMRVERARIRLLAELAACDPFVHSTSFEEYSPS